MAAAMLRVWESQGRPWRLCTPLLDMVGRLKVAYPRLVYGTLGDDAHLNAVPPEDHTPFSATGYPKTSPYPVVHALDVMHHPESGVDAGKLFAYWLGEAKAGRMPWLKYLIWQATIYDVRFGWRPQPSGGHFDHVHLSSRTDAESTHLGDWSPIPPLPEEDDDMHMVGSGASDGSIYVAPGFAAPSGKAAAFPLGPDLFAAYKAAGFKLVSLPAGMTVAACPVYDINPQPWPVGGGGGPGGAVDLTDASVTKVATAVVDLEHDRLAS